MKYQIAPQLFESLVVDTRRLAMLDNYIWSAVALLTQIDYRSSSLTSDRFAHYLVLLLRWNYC